MILITINTPKKMVLATAPRTRKADLIQSNPLHSIMGDEHEAARAFALGRRLLHEFKRRGSEWDEFFGMAAHYLQEKQWSNVIQMAELLDDGSITEPSEEELAELFKRAGVLNLGQEVRRGSGSVEEDIECSRLTSRTAERDEGISTRSETGQRADELSC